MDISYYTLARTFKSPPFVSIAALLRSRSGIKAKAKLAIDRCRELERKHPQLVERNRQFNERLLEAKEYAALMQQQRDQARASVNLPHDPPIGTHGYGAIMIALAVNLAMSIGFRGAAGAIRIFYDAFGLQNEITPHHDSIRNNAETVDHDVVIQRDAAHYAATQVKSILGKDEKFQQVISQMGTTRSKTQQTELGFLSPPTPKNKARFMNLSRIILWMTMMLWLLRNPKTTCLAGVDSERLRDKFAWIETYADQIPMWRSCQSVISTFVTFSNEQYLHGGASVKLAAKIGELKHPEACELRDRLVKFVLESESALQPGERLPLSTQLLESVFGQYKQLEGQHSKSGFTGLVSCIPLLHSAPTPASVRESFAKVTKKQVADWVNTHVGRTLISKRRAACAEHRKALKAQHANCY